MESLATQFARIVFEKVFADSILKAKAREVVYEALEKCEGNILILDKFAPWKEDFFDSLNEKTKDILFVIYPSKKGGYNIQTVPIEDKSFIPRKSIPVEWRNIETENLKKLTGINTAIHCNRRGYMATAETLQGAIDMANLAINWKK